MDIPVEQKLHICEHYNNCNAPVGRKYECKFKYPMRYDHWHRNSNYQSWHFGKGYTGGEFPCGFSNSGHKYYKMMVYISFSIIGREFFAVSIIRTLVITFISIFPIRNKLKEQQGMIKILFFMD